MNWEAIGAVGEVGGFVAVLITLIYLTLQIKQSNLQTRVLLQDSLNQHSMALWRAVMTTPALAELIAQAVDEEVRLSSTQLIQLRTWAQHEMMMYQNMLSLAQLADSRLNYHSQIEQMLKRTSKSRLIRKMMLQEAETVDDELKMIVTKVYGEYA